jgi:hypothetical protein
MLKVILFGLSFCFLANPLSDRAWASDDPAAEVQKDMERLQAEFQGALSKLQSKVQGNGQDLGARAEELRGKLFKLATDRNFVRSAEAVWQHPQRNNLLWFNLGFFVFMLFFKAWRQAKAKHWFSKVMVGLALSVFTWLGLFYFVPLAVLGKPFHDLVMGLYGIFF